MTARATGAPRASMTRGRCEVFQNGPPPSVADLPSANGHQLPGRPSFGGAPMSTPPLPPPLCAPAPPALPAATALAPAGATASGTRNDAFVTFTPATVVDPILFGGEPG